MQARSIIGTAIVATTLMTGTATAQCAFSHPKRARQVVLPLVQAFVPCNTDPACAPDGVSRTPNTYTDIGISACQPPQTFNQYAGAPPNGWLWGANGSGTVSFKAATNRIWNGLNPIPNTADVEVRLDLVGIEDADGLVDGTGVLWPNRRTTFEDRVGGDMTVIDLPFPNFAVQVVHGRAKVRTTANAWLNSNGFPGAPGCTSLELVGLELRDENNTLFASPGVLLPDIN